MYFVASLLILAAVVNVLASDVTQYDCPLENLF